MSSHPAMIEGPVYRYEKERGIWSAIRPLERAASLLMLIFFSPLLVTTAAVIVILSRRSPMVAHRRIGQFGAPFWTLKFRTMWPGGARGGIRLVEHIVDEVGPEYKSSDDPRVTSEFARFCRRFSVDELPQLVNVLRGEMSLVAPRPLTERELKRHYGSDAAEVLLVRPGITGMWQVMGRSRLSFDQRRELDLFLVRNRSLRLYVAILLRTIPAVMKGKDGW